MISTMEKLSTKHDLKSCIDGSVTAVFETLLGLELEPSTQGIHPDNEELKVIGMVGLAGITRGVLCLRVSQSFSHVATALMFGRDPETVQSVSDVNDVIGELTNIIAGKMIGYMQLDKELCNLSLPTITRGSQIDLETISSVDRHSFTFTLSYGPVIVELYSLKKENNGMQIPKILLVDDSKATRAVLAKLFFPYHCQIIEASDGAMGLEMARMHQPALVVLDMTMPVMNGIEMLERLKADEDMRHIPVIMLSANSNSAQIEQLQSFGLAKYVTKTQKPRVILDSALEMLKLEPKVAADQFVTSKLA